MSGRIAVVVGIGVALAFLGACDDASDAAADVSVSDLDATADAVTLPEVDGLALPDPAVDTGPESDDGAQLDADVQIPDVPADVDVDVDVGSEDTQADAEIAADGDVTDDTMPPGPPCGGPCPSNTLCTDGVCVLIDKPCGGLCFEGTYCEELTDTCKTSACYPPNTFSNHTQKSDVFEMLGSSQGCDLNGDDEPDNMLGTIIKVLTDANATIAGLHELGEFTMLLEAPGWNTTGAPFGLRGMPGEQQGSPEMCNPQDPAGNCSYIAWGSGFGDGPSGPCPPTLVFESVAVVDGVLQTIGTQDSIQVTLPLDNSVPVTFTVSQVTLTANVYGSETWAFTKDAVLCGVVRDTDIQAVVDQIPDYVFDDAGVSRASTLDLIELSLDVDTNNDGYPDALSGAAGFSTIPGAIVGSTSK